MQASRGRVAIAATEAVPLHPVRRKWFWCFLFAALIFLAPHSLAQEQVLVEAGSSMKYLANIADPGINGEEWTTESFNDDDWDDEYDDQHFGESKCFKSFSKILHGFLIR